MQREIGARIQSRSLYFVYYEKSKDPHISMISRLVRHVMKGVTSVRVLRIIILLSSKRIKRRRRRSTRQSKGWRSTDQGLSVKQLVPSEHHLIEVQLIQYDLCNTHEHFFPLHAAIVTPYCHLRRMKQYYNYTQARECVVRLGKVINNRNNVRESSQNWPYWLQTKIQYSTSTMLITC